MYIFTSNGGIIWFRLRFLTCLRTLSAVLRSALHSSVNALCVECSAYDMITYTREILYTSASDEDNAVLLELVSDTGNVSGYLIAVGESYSGYLTHSGVRLLRSCCSYCCAYSSLLGSCYIGRSLLKGIETLQECRSLRLLFGDLSSLSYKLVKGWQFISPPIENFALITVRNTKYYTQKRAKSQ